jgi:hypothetical protein
LGLTFYAGEGQTVAETRWADRPPGLAEAEMPPCEKGNSRALTLTLGQLEPRWSGIAMAWTSDANSPLLIFKLPRPVGSATEERAVYLMKANLTTWIIRNEFDLYYTLIVLLILLIVWYGVSYAQRD